MTDKNPSSASETSGAQVSVVTPEERDFIVTSNTAFTSPAANLALPPDFAGVQIYNDHAAAKAAQLFFRLFPTGAATGNITLVPGGPSGSRKASLVIQLSDPLGDGETPALVNRLSLDHTGNLAIAGALKVGSPGTATQEATARGQTLANLKISKDPDPTLSQPSNDRIATQAAVKEYVDNVGLGGVPFATRAQMEANLNFVANTRAQVTDDPTVANNGIWKKLGASGSGSWTQVSRVSLPALRDKLDRAVEDIGELQNELNLKADATNPAFAGGLIVNGLTSDSTSVGQINNYALQASTSILRFNLSAASQISGLANPSEGRWLGIHVWGGNSLTIQHQSNSSAENNRFHNGSSGNNILLNSGDSALYIYYGGRWHYYGGSN